MPAPSDLHAWAEIFGDPVAVVAMVDRLVHHAEVIVLDGERFRLRGKRELVLGGHMERWPAQVPAGVSCSGLDRHSGLDRP